MAHLSKEKRALDCDCRSRNDRSSRPRIPRHLDCTACYSLGTIPSTRAPGRSAPYRNTWEQFTSLPHQNYSPCRHRGEKPGLSFPRTSSASCDSTAMLLHFFFLFFFFFFTFLYLFVIATRDRDSCEFLHFIRSGTCVESTSARITTSAIVPRWTTTRSLWLASSNIGIFLEKFRFHDA